MLRWFFTLTLLTASPAMAALEFCNQTDLKVVVAIAYSDDEVWTSEGWWHVAAEECATLTEGDLQGRYYYYNAKSEALSWGDEGYFFCTSEEEFTIIGDQDCAARGYDRTEFNEIDTSDKTAYTMNLTLPKGGIKSTPAPLPMTDPMPGPDALIGNFEMKMGGKTVEISLPRGAHGEPYTVWGLLSHCDQGKGALLCEIHADGKRYIADSNKHAVAMILAAMAKLGQNIPIGITGDLVSWDGNAAQVTVRNFAPGGTDPYNDTREAMQGNWQSISENGYTLSIRGSVVQQTRGGTVTQSMLMFAETCPGLGRDGTAMVLKPFDAGAEETCLMIDGLGETLVLDAARVVFKYMD